MHLPTLSRVFPYFLFFGIFFVFVPIYIVLSSCIATHANTWGVDDGQERIFVFIPIGLSTGITQRPISNIVIASSYFSSGFAAGTTGYDGRLIHGHDLDKDSISVLIFWQNAFAFCYYP